MKGDPLLRSLERDPALHRIPEKNEIAGELITYCQYLDVGFT